MPLLRPTHGNCRVCSVFCAKKLGKFGHRARKWWGIQVAAQPGG
ncbi:hypothetical protein SLEP1_g28580 [Rubroshorea leprosula]|uniref:Uncharacterized protein n=1 Tax=Rubroshorea leprosula TaxID=152421 RepID=A0AAV5K3K0_9ROSI|nr:hypothetical protein SLEP1_g28580 [Rubroshorea leprosula]